MSTDNEEKKDEVIEENVSNEETNNVEENNEVVENTSNNEPLNNQNDSNVSETNNQEPKGNGWTVILSLIIIIVAIGIIVYGIVTFFGKSNVSKGKKFMELATSNQKILELIDTEKMENGQTNVKATVDIDNIVTQMGKEATGVGTLSLDNVQIVDDKNYYSSTKISLGNIKAELQLVKTGDIFGVNIPEITNKFIGIDTNDLDGLVNNLRRLGILTNTQDNDYTEEQSKELMEIFKKYYEVAVENIGEFIVENSNVSISLHGKTDTANEYVFTINGEAYLKIGVAVEKELVKNKSDLEKLAELGLIENADETLEKIENDIEKNEEDIKNGAYNDEAFATITLKLYEKKGKNIATVIEANGARLGLYVFETSKDNYEIDFESINGGSNIIVYWNTEKAENNISNGTVGIVYNDKDIKVTDITCEKLDQVEDELITISGDNVLLLNSATEEDLDNFSSAVSTNLQKYFMKLLLGVQE